MNRTTWVLTGGLLLTTVACSGGEEATPEMDPASETASALQHDLVVEVGWLAENLEAEPLVVLQLGSEDGYAEGHVPGARLISLDDVTIPMPEGDDRDEHLILQLLPEAELRSNLEGFGISDASTVAVVSTARAATQAARLVFTLDAAGFGEQTAFVNGGVEAWTAAGLPLTTDVPAPATGRITHPFPERVVEKEWLLEGGANDSGFTLVDGRMATFYSGERADRGKEGHIEGAVNVPGPGLFDQDEESGAMRMKDVEELRSVFAAAGIEPGDTVVAYCHIGQFATAVMMAARQLGHDVLLYDGSMNEWALEDLPVVR